VKGIRPFSHNETLWELGSGPARNALSMMWFYECLTEGAVDGIDTMLWGGMGNYAFSADGPMWLVDLARRGRLGWFASEVKAWAEFGGWKKINVLRRDFLKMAAPERLRAWYRKTPGAHDPLQDTLAAVAVNPERLEAVDLEEVLPVESAPPRRDFTRDLTRMFADMGSQAEQEGAVRVLFGLDLRDPTSNRDLIELALLQPDYWRRHAGVPRAVCRAAMRDVLPTEIVDRTTLGAQLPDWFDRMDDFKEDIKTEVKEMGDHPASREVIDIPMLERLIETWPQREQTADRDVIYPYMNALGRSIHVSRYVRWFEDRGRRVAAGGPAVVVRRPWEE
jgi:asparagine synthase (glutamine-hydrolysing)